jgi:hypothetical protein
MPDSAPPKNRRAIRKWIAAALGASGLSTAAVLHWAVGIKPQIGDSFEAYLNVWPSPGLGRWVGFVLFISGVCWCRMSFLRKNIGYQTCPQVAPNGRPLSRLAIRSTRVGWFWAAGGALMWRFPLAEAEFIGFFILSIALTSTESSIASARKKAGLNTASNAVRARFESRYADGKPMPILVSFGYLISKVVTSERGVSAFVAIIAWVLLLGCIATGPAVGRDLGLIHPKAETAAASPAATTLQDTPVNSGQLASPITPRELPATGPTVTLGPTYQQLCGAWPPASPVAGDASDALYDAWVERAGAPGAVFAGCADPIQPVPRVANTWYAEGRCDGELRGLGVVSATGDAAVVLYAAARLAEQFAIEGTLLRVEGRRDLGDGDMVVITTTKGSWMLIRATKGGEESSSADVGRCEGAAESGEPYVVLPPAAAHAFIGFIARTHTWAWPTELTRHGSGHRYSLRANASAPASEIGGLSCASDSACRDTGVPDAVGPTQFAADDIAPLAPSVPPRPRTP